VYHHPEEFTFNGKRFFIGHGDGLGPGDKKYKFIKKVFRSQFSKWIFSIMHPGLGISLANYFSRKSRLATGINDEVFLGEDKEWLISFSKEKLKARHFEYFIFGHRHLPIDFKINGATTYINLGDWIKYNSYAVFNGNTTELKYYKH
jgi:UDP-2,3-diacylglucosamine hydrolase